MYLVEVSSCWVPQAPIDFLLFPSNTFRFDALYHSIFACYNTIARSTCIHPACKVQLHTAVWSNIVHSRHLHTHKQFPWKQINLQHVATKGTFFLPALSARSRFDVRQKKVTLAFLALFVAFMSGVFQYFQLISFN